LQGLLSDFFSVVFIAIFDDVGGQPCQRGGAQWAVDLGDVGAPGLPGRRPGHGAPATQALLGPLGIPARHAARRLPGDEVVGTGLGGSGIVGTRDLIRVAVARDPRQAIPLHGCYLGSADAFVGMEVSINVVSAGEAQLIADLACGHQFLLGPPAPPSADPEAAQRARVQAIDQLRQVAAYFRTYEPHSPVAPLVELVRSATAAVRMPSTEPGPSQKTNASIDSSDKLVLSSSSLVMAKTCSPASRTAPATASK